MIEIYWACLVGGIIFAVVSLLLGGTFHHGLDAAGGADVGGDVGGADLGGHDFGGHDLGGHDAAGHDAAGHDGGGHTFDYLNPTTIVGGITILGGSGILLTRYTSLGAAPTLLLAVAAGFVLSMILHFVYVRPMRRSENSVGFSVKELPGRIGEITIPVPAGGYGEVMVRIGASNNCEIATSHDGEAIPVGETVVVTEIRGDVVVVARFDEWNALSESTRRTPGA